MPDNRETRTDCPLCRDVADALAGRNPRLVAISEDCIILVGEHQFFPGYCVVVAREHAKELHELSADSSHAIFQTVNQLAKAISGEWNADKINLASLGNVVEHVHWHVIPRQGKEVNRRKHPWIDESRFLEFKTTPEIAKKVASRLATFKF